MRQSFICQTTAWMMTVYQASALKYLSCEHSFQAGVNSGKHSPQAMLQQWQQQGKTIAVPGKEMVESIPI